MWRQVDRTSLWRTCLRVSLPLWIISQVFGLNKSSFQVRFVSMVNAWKKMVPTSADATWDGKRKLAMPAYLTGIVLTRVKVPAKSPTNADVPMTPAILMAFAKASSHLQINQFHALIYVILFLFTCPLLQLERTCKRAEDSLKIKHLFRLLLQFRWCTLLESIVF